MFAQFDKGYTKSNLFYEFGQFVTKKNNGEVEEVEK